MGKREGSVEDHLRKQVKANGGIIRKVRWIGRRGAADDLVSFGFPNVALVECKAEGEEVDWKSPQGREIERLRADGWPVYVVSSRVAVDLLISVMLEERGG